ncbi:MAG: hypothetical protein IKC40_02870 [Oscillospiraceae bacterium]|nr:hypothetical protein [Oscillospiraceae bacterium]
MKKRRSVIRIMVGFLCFSLVFFGIAAFLAVMAATEFSMEKDTHGYVLLEATVEDTRTYEETIQYRHKNQLRTGTATNFVADVRFEYEGETITGSVEGDPFAKKGDIVEVLYNPRTKELKLDFSKTNALVNNLFYAIPIVLLVLVGCAIAIPTLVIGGRKLKLYRESNHILGTIDDIQENACGNGVYQKTITLTFNAPDTGMPVTIRTTTTKNVSQYAGQSMWLYYNQQNPAASVIDL